MKVLAFLLTLLVLSLIAGYMTGGAAKLGGPEDPRQPHTPKEE